MNSGAHHSFVRWVIRAGILATFVANGLILASIATHRPLEIPFIGSGESRKGPGSVQAVFDERLTESLKYQRGSYKFANPSQ